MMAASPRTGNPIPAPGSGLAAVVLAAGAAERLGRRPKCLLELEGEPLVRRVCSALAEAGAAPVVVLGHYADAVAAALAGQRVALVVNPRPEEGQVSSQRLGLAASGVGGVAALIALADHPLLTGTDVAALIGAWQRRAAGIEVMFPEVEGQRGHPVILSARVREEILAAGAGFGCRQWQEAHPERVRALPTDNRHYVVDIDSEEDRLRFARETGRTLAWPAAWQAAGPARGAARP